MRVRICSSERSIDRFGLLNSDGIWAEEVANVYPLRVAGDFSSKDVCLCAAWCDILCKLFPLGQCFSKKVTEIKQKMRAPFAPARIRIPRFLLHICFLVLVAPAGFGQGTAIEPCPASPAVVNTPPINPARVITPTARTLVDSTIPA